MDSIANAVAGQDAVTVAGSWQRHLPARYLDRSMEGRSAYSRWGRDPGFPLLYLGRPTDSVVVEAYRHLIDPVEDAEAQEALRLSITTRVLVTADVHVSEILDLRTSRARIDLGLSLAQIQSQTHERAAYAACQEVAAAAHQQGFHGVLAPAATGMGETLALFSNRLPASEVPVVTSQTYWEQLPDDPRAPATRRLRVVRDD